MLLDLELLLYCCDNCEAVVVVVTVVAKVRSIAIVAVNVCVDRSPLSRQPHQYTDRQTHSNSFQALESIKKQTLRCLCIKQGVDIRTQSTNEEDEDRGLIPRRAQSNNSWQSNSDSVSLIDPSMPCNSGSVGEQSDSVATTAAAENGRVSSSNRLTV